MLLSEDEAKNRVCYRTIPTDCMCRASRCMAWRWGEWEPRTQYEADDPQRNRSRRGYCAAAGLPGYP